MLSSSCLRLTCASTLLVFAAAETALAQSDVSGTCTAVFRNPTGPSGMVASGMDTSRFVWGDPGTFGTGPCSLEFSGSSFRSDLATAFANGETAEFELGTLRYFNGTILLGSEAATVDLDVSIAFSNPSGVRETFQKTLSIFQTPNTGDPCGDADEVLLPTEPFEFTISDGSVTANMKVKGFSRISQGGCGATVDRFRVQEARSATAVLVATFTLCPRSAGFLPTPLPVPGTSQYLCMKSITGRVRADGTFANLIEVKNPYSTLNVAAVICSMSNTMVDQSAWVDPRDWIVEYSASGWRCLITSQNALWPPSFHHGCHRYTLPAGGIVRLAHNGHGMPPNAPMLSPYVDVLRDALVASNCNSSIIAPNQFLIPDAPPATYANTWQANGGYFSLGPDGKMLRAEVVWPVGNWFTMGFPNQYPARLQGTILDAPTGTVVTLHFPPGIGVPLRTFVVPPADPSNPSCFGQPVMIDEPFLIPPGPADLLIELVVPETCGSLPEGFASRFVGRAVADVGVPAPYSPGDFIVSHSGVFVVDRTPPEIHRADIVAMAGGGGYEIRVEATDAVSTPLEAELRFSIDGGAEQRIWMDFADPSGFEGTTFFVARIAAPAGAMLEVRPQVFDDLGNARDFCSGSVASYGVGVAGSGAIVPRLGGLGCPVTDSRFELVVSGGSGGTPGCVGFGTAPTSTPFFGGTLLTLPLVAYSHVLEGPPGVPGIGTASVVIEIPADASLVGQSVYVQSFYCDPSAVSGISMTQGVRVLIGG